MINPETILCPNCNSTYSVEESVCPACGVANPLLEEELFADDPAAQLTTNKTRKHRSWWRSPGGCFSIIIFILLIIGGVILGGYDGLKEQGNRRQAEIARHYQQALTYKDNNQIDLAIAELNQTLTLNPAHTEARTLLRDLKANQPPTPTQPPLSQTSAVENLFTQAKAFTLQGDWEKTIQYLKQIRDLDPTYQPTIIAESLYTANFELGLRLIKQNKPTEALHAFDAALVERPNDPTVTAEWEKVSLYLSLSTPTANTIENDIVVLSRLYALDPTFADVAPRLYTTYKTYADSMMAQNNWCLAAPRYQSAAQITPGAEIESLAAAAQQKCDQNRPAASALNTPQPNGTAQPDGSTGVISPTQTTAISGSAGGTLYFARFSNQNNLWEIIALNMAAGKETILLSNGTQPAISPDNSTLVYQSQSTDSMGLHGYNLVTGNDLRLTTYTEDVLPRWGSNTQQFVFASQRSGDRRWQIFIGYADGKGDATPLQDGRTPAPSPNAGTLVYQGTDPQGNNPGLYTMPSGGGESIRLTNHESDRSPAVSTTGQVAFMSTQSGNWDIWTIPVTGGQATLLVPSPANDGLPVWSPDGQTLAFVSDRSGSWDIYVVSASGGTPQKVATWGTPHPDWLMEQLDWGR